MHVYGTLPSHVPKLAQPALLIKLLLRTPLIGKLAEDCKSFLN